MRRPPNAPRRVTIVLFDGVQLLDVVGPLEIFAGANELLRRTRHGSTDAYEVKLAAPGRRAVRASSGITLTPAIALERVRPPLDTLLVPGALDVGPCVARGAAVVRALSRLARATRRVVSVCTGAFFLAEAGLVDGRRVTTHWAAARALAEAHPAVDVDSDPIFVRDGPVYTSAGVTAGMDLALALVEEDFDRGLALELARWFVMYLKRPGGQSQFSVRLRAQRDERSTFGALRAWVADHLREPWTVPRLAARAAMSPRHFARTFAAEAGTTPARFVAELRVEEARRLLEETDLPIKVVAARAGLGSVEAMRRSFRDILGATPSDYRARFVRARP